MNQLDQTLPDLALWVRVVEKGSFAAAARDWGQTPSAVSRRVARLEEAMGVRLLERTTRKLHLTQAGEQALAHGQAMLAAAQTALDGAQEVQQAPQGLVRLCAPRAVCHLLIHPLMPDFLAKYPQIQVQLVVTDQPLDPLDGAVDLVIRLTDQPPAGMAARPLRPVRQVLCASPTYLTRAGTPTHPSDLAAHNCLYLGEHPLDHRWRLRHQDERVTVAVQGRYVVNHTQIRLDSALQHLGIAALPDFVLQAALDRGDLVEVLPDWQLDAAYAGQAWLLYPSQRHLLPRLRVLIDHLAQGLALPTPPGQAGSVP